jgi:hypothetical protein
MKVKLFWSNNPRGGRKGANPNLFEDQINAWLRENPRIKVLDIKQSATGRSFNPSLWLISIWYEDRAD